MGKNNMKKRNEEYERRNRTRKDEFAKMVKQCAQDELEGPGRRE